MRQHSPEAARIFEWVNTRYYTTDIPALHELHPGLMDFETWLEKEGKAKVEALLGAEQA